MRAEFHPPLVITTGSSAVVADCYKHYIHASLWLVVELHEWSVTRRGHVHLVRSVDSEVWRPVDLSRHALQVWQGGKPEIPTDDAAESLARWLGSWQLRFYRIPELALVSELGESGDDFRRRVQGPLGAELRIHLEAIKRVPRPRRPWRRRSGEKQRIRRRNRLSAEVARIFQDMEELACQDPMASVQRSEIGVLLVDKEIALRPHAHKDLML